MNPTLKYSLIVAGLFLFVLGVLGACLFDVWFNLVDRDRAALARIAYENINLLIFCALVMLLGIAWVVHLFFKLYIWPATLVNEDAKIMLTANPSHRIELYGARELRQVVRHMNTFAERSQALQQEMEARIRTANVDVEAEKNRLAALMSDLTQSVLVCNGEGRILLYNSSARQLFAQPSPGQASNSAGALVGLGRSIFGVIDRNLIVHALETIDRRMEQGDVNPVAQFVATMPGGQLVRAHVAPVRDQQNENSGFILTLEDITRVVERSNRRDVLLQSLTEGTRSTLANIRAAVETILDYPDMDIERRNQFTQIIQEETVGLSTKLDHTLTEFAKDFKAGWMLEDILGSDLLAAIQRSLERKLHVSTCITAVDEPLWLKVDSFSIVQALISIVRRLQTHRAITDVALSLHTAGNIARLDVIWRGAPLGAETLLAWEQQPLLVEGEGSPLTLHEVVERHGGEIWGGAGPADGTAYVRLLLPSAQPQLAWNEPVVAESRPEYYDFDLFHQPDNGSELDERLLTELTLTVFDTETTGLNPSEGDEVISIGAVRIVNGRLLRHEIFDQLINPRRPVSEASIRVHGITPQMLRGQPTIDQALPLFAQFAEDTVLVAHNAAFDMRFFQVKEAQAGIALTQPVLDTLLLSLVVHPNQAEHSLDAIARRLGVNVIGRHTALGDAIVAGEVFLRLIPLLAAQGICTLKDAREAAQKTYYARIKY